MKIRLTQSTLPVKNQIKFSIKDLTDRCSINYQLSTAVMVQLSDIQNSEIYSFYFLSLKFNKHSFFASILWPRKNHFEIKNDAETCRDKLL